LAFTFNHHRDKLSDSSQVNLKKDN